MGALECGGKSVVPKRVPAGDGRGIEVVVAAVKSPWLETGTTSEVWKTVKALLEGPKGWKGVRVVSEEMMDLPSAVWAVTTRRGGGRDAMARAGLGWCAGSEY